MITASILSPWTATPSPLHRDLRRQDLHPPLSSVEPSALPPTSIVDGRVSTLGRESLSLSLYIFVYYLHLGVLFACACGYKYLHVHGCYMNECVCLFVFSYVQLVCLSVYECISVCYVSMNIYGCVGFVCVNVHACVWECVRLY